MLQFVAAPAPQTPLAEHVSPVVHGSPSSHELPGLPATISHCFSASLQLQRWQASACGLPPPVPLVLVPLPVPVVLGPPPVPVVLGPPPVPLVLVPPPAPLVLVALLDPLDPLDSGQTLAVPTQAPATHTSVVVQNRPSSHLSPSLAASAIFTQTPAEQTPRLHASATLAQSAVVVQALPPWPPIPLDVVLAAPPAPLGITSPGALRSEQAEAPVSARERPAKKRRRIPKTRKGGKGRQEDGAWRA